MDSYNKLSDKDKALFKGVQGMDPEKMMDKADDLWKKIFKVISKGARVNEFNKFTIIAVYSIWMRSKSGGDC